jgi:hypothetical protein
MRWRTDVERMFLSAGSKSDPTEQFDMCLLDIADDAGNRAYDSETSC